MGFFASMLLKKRGLDFYVYFLYTALRSARTAFFNFFSFYLWEDDIVSQPERQVEMLQNLEFIRSSEKKFKLLLKTELTQK
jgi:hypothetical protein